MSVNTPSSSPEPTSDVAVTGSETTRRLVLAAAAVLVVTYVGVLWNITTVVGGRIPLLAVSVLAVALATASARRLDVRTALSVGGLTFLAGTLVYLFAIPQAFFALATFERVVHDVYVLLTGNLSILQIIAADTWAIAMAPTPIYLTWYLALRRHYEYAALVGGLALGFFILSGDASTVVTLSGATSVLALVGLGAAEERDASWRQVQDLGLLLVAAVLVSRLVRLVPKNGIASGPSAGGGGGPTAPTLEGSLVAAGDTIGIYSSISLSPKVRWEVDADRPAFWHVDAYDRFTGQNWVQSGESKRYAAVEEEGGLASPPGEFERVEQRYTALTEIATLPAAWRPWVVTRPPRTQFSVTSEGGLRPKNALTENQTYAVTSRIPSWTDETLRAAGMDYSDAIESRYTQVPDSTPARVARKASDVTADAETPYDAAVAIQRWLQANKNYSLTVGKPGGDIVDSFLFKLDRGYCVFFASAMVVMLRTQGIPARFAVGYTPGEQVDENRWVVRGYDSHAWVEVYFPGIGWVPFDPTPADGRADVEQRTLESARQAGRSNVDTDATLANDGGEGDDQGTTDTPTPTATSVETTPEGNTSSAGQQGPQILTDDGPEGPIDDITFTATATPTPEGPRLVAGNAGTDGNTSTGSPELGDLERAAGGRDRLTLLASVAGLALGAYRLQLVQRGYQSLQMRFQRRTDDPSADTVRAFERLELLLARHYRDRQENETPRRYLSSIDDERVDGRAHRVAALYELAHYGDGTSRSEADEAIDLVDELVHDHGRLP